MLDNNTRTVVMQTGEANFAFRIPPEQAAVLQTNPTSWSRLAPSIVQRFLTMNELQKPFDNLKVRQAINYAIDKDALVKVAFTGYAVPAAGVVPPGVEYATKLGPWPYDPAKARALLKEAGYPNGFESDLWSAYNNTTAQKVIQFVQQQLAQVGIKVKVRALETGENVEKVLGAPDPKTAPVRLYYAGWSSSTGEADWALRPLLASQSWPPKMFQRGLLQERSSRCRHRQRSQDDRPRQESQPLCRCAKAHLGRRGVGLPGYRKEPLRAQQEHIRHLRHA